MSGATEPIRSYQRVFAPERRIHQVEGKSLPVPGGVPLRWLGWCAGAFACLLALGSASIAAPLAAALAAGVAGAAIGGPRSAALAALGGFAGAWALGIGLGLLEWPLRLVVAPAAIATLATQATPDGRRAQRFAASWLSLRLGPQRRSLGRALPRPGGSVALGGKLWVAPDEHSPRLARGRVGGPAEVRFAAPVALRRSGLRGDLRARPARVGEMATRRVEVRGGEALEVSP